jgi:hypothetical protein
MNGHSRGAGVQDAPLLPVYTGLSDGVMPPKTEFDI